MTRWQNRVNEITVNVRRDAIFYFVLGIALVVISAVGLYLCFGNSPITGIAFMGFFYLMIIFFSTLKIYPCIRGGFLISLEQSYETMPIFEKADGTVERIDRLAGQIERSEHPLLVQIRDDMAAIRKRIERDTEPIKALRRPVVEVPDRDGT